MGVLERMGGNLLFSLTPMPGTPTTVGVFTQATLCSLRDREGASPFQSEALVSGERR